ncbi:MAG: Maf-like protein [Phycisphaerales bacterium]|nr:Maf-like protein [Phycisphaerales bacterium]
MAITVKHKTTVAPPLILASASPRRAQLLTEAGYRFTVIPSTDRELAHRPHCIPVELWPACVAFRKAIAIEACAPRNSIILAADTTVVIDGIILNKAANRGAAKRMLSLLSGKRHRVLTGLAIIWHKQRRMVVAESVLQMRRLSQSDLEAYLDSQLWRGKAGAYGIQDERSGHDPFVRLISGEWSNVVGLPLDLFKAQIASLGVHQHPQISANSANR